MGCDCALAWTARGADPPPTPRNSAPSHDISPIYYVTPDDPPTFIMHGDKDNLVPLQQSETFIEKLKEAGVECKLVVKKGGGHPWPDLIKDFDKIVDWFDGHLNKATASTERKAG